MDQHQEELSKSTLIINSYIPIRYLFLKTLLKNIACRKRINLVGVYHYQLYNPNLKEKIDLGIDHQNRGKHR